MNPFYQREFIFRYGYSWIEWDSTQKLQPKPTKNQNNIWFACVKEMRRPCLMQCAFVHTETSEQRGKYHVMHSNKNISQHIKSKQYLTHSKSECSMVTLWSFQFIHLGIEFVYLFRFCFFRCFAVFYFVPCYLFVFCLYFCLSDLCIAGESHSHSFTRKKKEKTQQNCEYKWQINDERSETGAGIGVRMMRWAVLIRLISLFLFSSLHFFSLLYGAVRMRTVIWWP